MNTHYSKFLKQPIKRSGHQIYSYKLLQTFIHLNYFSFPTFLTDEMFDIFEKKTDFECHVSQNYEG